MFSYIRHSVCIAMLAIAVPAVAQDVLINDAYARSASPVAKAGAAFLVIENATDQDDRLIGVKTDAAKRAELHTHEENADGVMSMVHVEDGFPLPAKGMIMMKRGGDHVMLMGLTEPFEQGEMIGLTLTFEKAGDVAVNVPVDLERKPEEGHSHTHGSAD